MKDPFVKVAGNGIKKLQEAGISVVTDVLREESLALNKRFVVFNKLNRPYIILKWAQTKDGFMDMLRAPGEVPHINWITEDKLKMLVHKWRSEEDAVMVGTTTARNDNPQLNVREWVGRNPVRIVLDEHLDLQEDLFILDQTSRTLVITSKTKTDKTNLEYISLDFTSDLIPSLLHALYTRGIQSVLVEGGKELLESFIKL
jgi:diaminohydroxyphosphoribosylaminopyrimidine deaminase/5-amino-6-(5-phosphoribosylamino)uracil reductase